MDRDHYRDNSREDLPRQKRRWRFGLSTAGLVAISTVIATAVLVRKALRRAGVSRQVKATEQRHDKSLQDTYPASDPPASQYFDIPVNRR